MAFDDKSKLIQDAMRAFAPHGENLGQKKGACAWCGQAANSFRDALSKKEFGISGMCQGCQDEVFGKEEE